MRPIIEIIDINKPSKRKADFEKLRKQEKNRKQKELKVVKQKYDKLKTQIARLGCQEGLVLLLSLLPTARMFSDKTAEQLLDEHMQLFIGNVHMQLNDNTLETSSILIAHKAMFRIKSGDLAKAESYAVKALKYAQIAQSDQAQANAFYIRGHVYEVMHDYQKAIVWYLRALDICTQWQKPIILLAIGKSYISNGQLDLAWNYVKDARKLSGCSSLSGICYTIEEEVSGLASLYYSEILSQVGDTEGALALQMTVTPYAYTQLDIEYNRTLPTNIENFNSSVVIESNKLGPLYFYVRTLEGRKQNTDYGIDLFHARYNKRSKRYEYALINYVKCLHGISSNTEKQEEFIGDMIKNRGNSFNEIIDGIYECLISLGDKKADKIALVKRLYYDVVKESGSSFRDSLRQKKLKQHTKTIINIISAVFPAKWPSMIRYYELVAMLDPRTYEPYCTLNRKEVIMSKRTYLLLKCLHEADGKCVTHRELIKYLNEHGDAATADINDSGLRTNINRDLREKLDLTDNILNCEDKKKGGWYLLPETQ